MGYICLSGVGFCWHMSPFCVLKIWRGKEGKTLVIKKGQGGVSYPVPVDYTHVSIMIHARVNYSQNLCLANKCFIFLNPQKSPFYHVFGYLVLVRTNTCSCAY